MKTDRPFLARLALWGLAVALLLAVPLAAASRVVRCGSLREPTSIDPARVWDDSASFYIGNIFDTLVTLDPHSQRVGPGLARHWQTSSDGRTWTFDLRSDVRFHDGTPFNADAVVFSFFRQMDPANPDRRAAFPMFAEIFTHLQAVRKSGPYQVQFILSEPFFPFLATLTVECAAIVSPTAVKKYAAAFGRHPVGTGPFRLRSWQKDKRLVLAANPDYWRGPPGIDEFIDIIDPQTSVLNKQFSDGSLDILSAISISKIIGYQKLDWARIVSTPYLSVTYMVLNSSRPGLKKKGVRQALGHAWDPRTLTLVFQDHVLPAHSLLPPGLLPEKSAVQPIGFSLERARELLKREEAGKQLTLEFLLNKEDGLIFQLLSMYAKNLKQVGVRLKLVPLETELLSRRIAAGDFDLAYSGWIADYPDPDSMLFPLLSPELLKQGFVNIAVCRRPDLQEKLALARREGNSEARGALYRAIDRIMIADGLVIPMYQDKRIYVLNRRLGNLQPNALGKLLLFDIKIQ